MTRKVAGSLSEVSRDSTKPTKMIAEQENNFGKTEKNFIPPQNHRRPSFNKFE